ncbi:MAG TPA: glycosyltransferase [Desulfuromonadales bacterium]|nr:glycosyltransferase [Desulfuromonadales bacterium]
MRILFIHQNFPGQFKHLAPALVEQGHDVTAFSMQPAAPEVWCGVRIIRYQPARGSTPGIHPWIVDIETKAIRGEAAFHAATALQQSGYVPDVIIAHPGWGESLFLKEIWPDARLGIYCEFFYHAHGADVGFDPEFPSADPGEVCRQRLKNVNNLLHFESADAGISPTHWQASTFPEAFRSRISVIHDGIDTAAVAPNPNVKLTLNGDVTLTRQDKVITFVNRNLEPYRGYHMFMRALPEILRNSPDACVLIVGGDDVSYGARPPQGTTWKSIFIDEVSGGISTADWKRVHFLGNIPYQHFIALLQVSTVHAYLTYPFVLGWSLLEAMSAGCAIVASDTQPLREAITDGVTGRLVDFFDVKQLAAQVTDLLGKPAVRETLGNNARTFAVEQYDLASVCLPRQLAWVQSIMS